ncbi:MAG TPA: hypothetical protein VFA59_07460 [Vicinamibacterales bacterium]|nr:hypothetical protein [Vicinamibacterales bacterium]
MQRLLAVIFAGALATNWFSSSEPLALRVEAPLDDLFAHAEQEGYAVRGTLAVGSARVDDVKVTVRGHTSRRDTECTFPKLKLAWGDGSLKLGTHCGESTDNSVTAKFGRLPNERSPWREAFAYDLLDAVGVPTLRARRARVTYVDTDDGGEPFTRNALIVEDERAAMKRLGATRSIAEAQFTTARDAFSVDDSATLAFAEAMIGNFDWCLRFFKGDTYRCDPRHPLWNLLALTWPDGRTRPLMYDFDVAGIVAGYHRWFRDIFNENYAASKSHAEIEVTAQLQHARTLFDRETLDATRTRFAEKKEAAYRLLETANVDADARRIITSYLDPFFDAMTSDAAFYRPVITAPNTMAYADASRGTAVCASRGPLKKGTAVSDPIDTRGPMVQVFVLDTLWQYAPPVQCPAIHKGPVWIDKSAVSTDYP